MVKRYDYIVLDIDGTLYSHRKYIMACKLAGKRLAEYAESEKIPKRFLVEMMANVRKGHVAYTISEICRRYGKERMRFANHVYDIDPSLFGISKDKRLLKEIRKLEGVSDIAVFTNSPCIWALRVLSELGIRRLIENRNIVTLEKLEKGKIFKPSRASFLRLLRVLHTSPDRIIFLDDDKRNVEEARKMGIRSVLVCNDGKCHIDGHSACRTVYEELGALANSDK